MKPEKLDDDEGYEVYNMKFPSPNSWVISNRSSIVTFYKNTDGPDGSMYMINSSLGNEALIEKYKESIGKDVIANAIIGGVRLTPYDGGVEVVNTICTDIGGKFPDFIKDIIAKR